MKLTSPKRKITAQMWIPVIDKLNEATTAACLNRDAYFDLVLSHEAAMLKNEAAGLRNSDHARNHVKRWFLELKNHRPVSLTLNAETADAIQKACDEVNVWRDVFINRVAYLLVAKSDAIELQWDFEFRNHRDAIFDEGADVKGLLLTTPLVALRSFMSDPFIGLRTALSDAHPNTNGKLHMRPLGNPQGQNPKERGLAGLSTYLEDKWVPGTPENEAHQKWADELLANL